MAVGASSAAPDGAHGRPQRIGRQLGHPPGRRGLVRRVAPKASSSPVRHHVYCIVVLLCVWCGVCQRAVVGDACRSSHRRRPSVAVSVAGALFLHGRDADQAPIEPFFNPVRSVASTTVLARVLERLGDVCVVFAESSDGRPRQVGTSHSWRRSRRGPVLQRSGAAAAVRSRACACVRAAPYRTIGVSGAERNAVRLGGRAGDVDAERWSVPAQVHGARP